MNMLSDPSRKYRPFPAIDLKDRRWPDRAIESAPIWCSVDLRDGNQALIEPMDTRRKARMFDALVDIGFKEIEVGFPSASQTDFDFIRTLIEQHRIPEDVTVQVLTQAREDLIRRTFEALRGAPRAIMHLYHATAPVMRRVVFGMTQDQVIDQLTLPHVHLIRELAKTQPDTRWTFQYSPEMFSGTELEFSRRIVDVVTEAWEATPGNRCIINLPSTVEHSTPNVFADMVEWMDRNLARRDAIVLSVHPHNDRGTGAAAAELALLAGIDRVEGCLFGNGERTGNVDIVTLALNMYSQGLHPGLNFSDIDAIRSTVEHCNQLPVHPRHPYGGELVYTSFSGSHQDAIRKAFAARQDDDIWDMPYLPIDPKDVGRSYEAVIRVNSQSGKGGIAYLMETDHGLNLPRRMQIEFSQTIQHLTDQTGKEVSSAELWRCFDKEFLDRHSPVEFVTHRRKREAASRTPGRPSSARRSTELQFEFEVRINGRAQTLPRSGQDPVDAFVDAMRSRLNTEITLMSYRTHAVKRGEQDAWAAYMELKVGQTPVRFGAAVDADETTATLRAIACAVNRARSLESEREPNQHDAA